MQVLLVGAAAGLNHGRDAVAILDLVVGGHGVERARTPGHAARERAGVGARAGGLGAVGVERVGHAELQAAPGRADVGERVVNAQAARRQEGRTQAVDAPTGAERIDRAEHVERARARREGGDAAGDHRAEVALQASPGLTAEQAPALQRVAGRHVVAGFEGEDGGQAAAKVLGATHAEAAARLVAALDADEARLVVGLQDLHADIDDAVHGHVGLGERGAAERTKDRQGDQTLLHALLS